MPKKKKKSRLTPSSAVSEHPGLTFEVGGKTFKGSLAEIVRDYDAFKEETGRSLPRRLQGRSSTR